MKTDKYKRNPRLQRGAIFVNKSSIGKLFWCTIRRLRGDDKDEFISGDTMSVLIHPDRRNQPMYYRVQENPIP